MDPGSTIFDDPKRGRVDFNNPWVQRQSYHIIRSYELCTGEPMEYFKSQGISNINLDQIPSVELAKQLFFMPYAILSHDVVGGNSNPLQVPDIFEERDNMYNYSNLAALESFERTFQSTRTVPSTKSAKGSSAEQAKRNSLIGDCIAKGHVRFRDAIRVSSTGRKVFIKEGVLFNLQDEYGIYRGQAVIIGVNDVSLGDF